MNVPLAEMAERMNRLPQVGWDRCVVHDGKAVVYGWISRKDGHYDFVLLEFQWGTTNGLDGDPVEWLAVGITTSSSEHSEAMGKLLNQGGEHLPCVRIVDVFGVELIDRHAEFGRRA